MYEDDYPDYHYPAEDDMYDLGDPGDAEETTEPDVYQDDCERPTIPIIRGEHMRPDDLKPKPGAAVVEAIMAAFPRDAARILSELRWHPGDGFWSFTYAGMFVGVELDGYIHT